MRKEGSSTQGTNPTLGSKQLKALGRLGFAIVDGQIELRPEYLRHDHSCQCEGCEVVIAIKRTFEAQATFVKTYPLYVSRCNLHTRLDKNHEDYEDMLDACRQLSGSACWHEAKLLAMKHSELWGKYPQEHLLRTIGTSEKYESLWINYAAGNREAIDAAILELWQQGAKIEDSDNRHKSGYQNWRDYHKNLAKEDYTSVNSAYKGDVTWLSKSQHKALTKLKANLA